MWIKTYKKKPYGPYEVGRKFPFYWWNPIIYLAIFIAFFWYIWDGGIKGWMQHVKYLIKDYDWD